MITEYYTLGSASEPEGLTPMTRVLDGEGNPVIQYGNSPKDWYKAKRVTKEEYDKLFGPGAPAREGLFGVVNAEGKAKADEQRAGVKATIAKKQTKMADHEIKKIGRLLSMGLINQGEISQEIENLRLPPAIKARVEKKMGQEGGSDSD